jgi:crotonobetainyl-CoA:carnitine CoA-transferase CaiB-like acyl-CoA transferase
MSTPASTGLPLEGVKVIELAEHGFVPSAAAALADWGANVVKLEKPGGDALRLVQSQGLIEQAEGFNYVVEIANRNKRNLCLDLAIPEGRALFDRLIAWADVFVTNQLPKVLRKFRIEAEDLFRVNPRLVYARGHGQGQKGPDAEAGGFDGVSFFARAGLAHMLTPVGAPSIIGSRPALGDFPTGVQLAGGIAAALVKSLRTGKGVKVDVSLLAGGVWQLGPDLAFTSFAKREPGKMQIGRPVATPLVATHQTSDNRYVSLSMLQEERYWPRICRALGLDAWIEKPEYATAALRAPHAQVIHAEFGCRIAAQPLAHWKQRLSECECVFASYASPLEVLDDPQVEANGYLPAHPTIPGARLPATPQQFDDRPVQIRSGAPSCGQHSDEVLREIGLGAEEIASLREAAAIR